MSDLPVAAPDHDKALIVQGRTFASNVRTHAARSPEGIAQMIEDLADLAAALLAERQQDKERIERLTDALMKLYDLSTQQRVDWMHFHELAMVEPFTAEAEALAFCLSVSEVIAAASIESGHEWSAVHPAALAVEEDAPKDQRFPPLEACDCGSAQEDHGWACRCDNPPSKRAAVEEDAE